MAIHAAHETKRKGEGRRRRREKHPRTIILFAIIYRNKCEMRRRWILI